MSHWKAFHKPNVSYFRKEFRKLLLSTYGKKKGKISNLAFQMHQLFSYSLWKKLLGAEEPTSDVQPLISTAQSAFHWISSGPGRGPWASVCHKPCHTDQMLQTSLLTNERGVKDEWILRLSKTLGRNLSKLHTMHI